MQKKNVYFYTVFQEDQKWMKKFFSVKIQKFGNKLLIEFMFKKVFYYIALENYGKG